MKAMLKDEDHQTDPVIEQRLFNLNGDPSRRIKLFELRVRQIGSVRDQRANKAMKSKGL